MTEQNNNSQPEAELTSTESSQANKGPTNRNPGPGSGRNRMKKRRWMKPVMRRVKVLKNEQREEDKQHEGKTGGLKIIHFGGLGEVGRNMSAIQYDDDIILIDAGVRFPESDEMPGIDFIIPNVEYLADKKDMVKAMFFTHGHLDHIGALPFVRDKIGDPDVYAAPLTKALIMKRLDEFKHLKPLDIHQVDAGEEIKISDKMTVQVLRISHSIPDDMLIAVKTPAGTIIHTSDFKFDETPVNDKPADIEKLQKLAEEGVLLLESDSTGAENEGHSLSEQDITDNLDKIIGGATGMLIMGTFASLINRIQQIITISEKYGRKVVFDGYSMKTNVEVCKKLGYLKMRQGTQISMDQIDDYPREKVTAVVTGAQGEDNAVLMRIANGEHKYIQIKKSDTIVFSSSVIPGNERSVQFLKDQLYRNGAKVFNYRMMDIHAGGHGNREDLRQMLKLVKPKFFMPIHGQYSMMVNHGLMAQEEGVDEKNVIIADNGSIVHVDKENWWFDKAKAPSDYVFVDGLGIGDIGNVVLRDRQILSEDGFIVVVTLVDRKTGKVRTSPDIISRGFVYLKDHKDLLMQIRKKIRFIVENNTAQGKDINDTYLKDEIRNQIGLFLFQKTERRPMVLPVVIEV
ncbi:MAG TPA: ribonuclease J [Candidatus Paceibacterota bacterium]|nr:ribonuclease J [Candidatus Paceibacterota bacterium]